MSGVYLGKLADVFDERQYPETTMGTMFSFHGLSPSQHGWQPPFFIHDVLLNFQDGLRLSSLYSTVGDHRFVLHG